MKSIFLSDVTISKVANQKKYHLTFREKLDIAKLLDRLEVSIIELSGMLQPQVDSLLIKSIAALVKNSKIAVPVSLVEDDTKEVWEAVSKACQPRLQVVSPVSAVQMEYLFHKKPAAILEAVTEKVKACHSFTENVEFVAEDATRSDKEFLKTILNAAIEAGASTVTLCDTAGTLLPDEFSGFLKELFAEVPALETVRIGVSCSNELAMADSCAAAALKAGACEVKTTSLPLGLVSLEHLATLLHRRSDMFSSLEGVRITELKKRIRQIETLCLSERNESSPFEDGVQEAPISFTCHDDRNALNRAIESLGYDLNEEDKDQVWKAFLDISSHKEEISARELDAIIASHAMQVPSAYRLESYIINSSSLFGSTAQLKLLYHDKILTGLSGGDGPIDAAFLAIEKITGRHFELDDFQIRSVTEGREAMGETIIRLRFSGKLYSGRGISTDITESGIHAYINALNKIVYEEVE